MNLDIVYVAMPIAAENLAVTLPALRNIDIAGLSVTIPHKEAVIPCLDSVSDAAQALRAVNCIHHNAGRLEGHNTDGAGFVRALTDEAGFEVNRKKCVVLGAGGAARAVIAALGLLEPRDLVVVNRTAESAKQAASLGGGNARTGEAAEAADADLVVNATPVGMGYDTDETPLDASFLNPKQLVVDLIYHPAKTRLLTEAEERGAQTMNGLAMLVYQAALQIELWTNQFPPIDVMFAALQ